MGYVCPTSILNQSRVNDRHSDFADAHPTTRVIGTDLSPIQPTWIPPNLHFEVDDCCDDWVYGKDSFDFIHARGLYGCVADWDKFYKEALKYAPFLPPFLLRSIFHTHPSGPTYLTNAKPTK